MPLPVPNLDDRRFDDLVDEARARLAAHLPELTRLSPGDPVHALVDLFAWFTETILYRANLIPERQRRLFLNLLQIPVRPARPARGLVCIDASPTSVALTPLVRDGSQLLAGDQALTCVGELQPTPLSLQVAIKERLDPDALVRLGFSLQQLREQFGLRPGEQAEPFRPRSFQPGQGKLSLVDSLDKAYYLAFSVPRQLQGNIATVRERLAGLTLNLALAPFDEAHEPEAQPHELRDKAWGLEWALISTAPDGGILYLPLEVLSDTSLGGRECGVVRLRLPRNPALFRDFAVTDPMFAGVGESPPELVDEIEPARVAFWLRLRSPDVPDLPLGYLDVNAVEVLAQGLRRDLIVGIGTGQPAQSLALPDTDIDPGSLRLEVEEDGAWVPWERVDFLAGQDPSARVYRLDAAAGQVFFGDGVSAGRPPPGGRRIRIQSYRHGGGVAGNLPAGSVRSIVDGSPRHRVRHAWPLRGGVDAETVEQAEQRIPQFLTHRNRAVTRDDYRVITETNPVVAVARAEVREGFLPGAALLAAREGVPGVVSVFVLPPGEPALGRTPKPTRRLLKDVFDYLVPRVAVGTELYVLSPQFVPVAFSLIVTVRDVATEQQTLRAVRQAMVEMLWVHAPGGIEGRGWPMGGTIRPNELSARAARVDGVLAINAEALFVEAEAGWRRMSAGEVLPLATYQLPELVGVRVESGDGGTPALPAGIGPIAGDGPTEAGPRLVPVPVIPDVC